MSNLCLSTVHMYFQILTNVQWGATHVLLLKAASTSREDIAVCPSHALQTSRKQQGGESRLCWAIVRSWTWCILLVYSFVLRLRARLLSKFIFFFLIWLPVNICAQFLVTTFHLVSRQVLSFIPLSVHYLGLSFISFSTHVCSLFRPPSNEHFVFSLSAVASA